ncbi:MAG TPA: hypothetical protein VN615_10920 [Gaiellales bacterium]|nr:hypothetical protein [Gaiellales bacterium]
MGFGSAHSFMVASTSTPSTWCQSWAAPYSPAASSARSYPAENARPAPVTTTTFTSSSAVARSIASCRPASTALLMAFSFSGRLRVIHAAGPRVS